MRAGIGLACDGGVRPRRATPAAATTFVITIVITIDVFVVAVAVVVIIVAAFTCAA